MSAEKALEKFQSGNVAAAQDILDEAAKTQKEVSDLLAIHCVPPSPL